MEFQEVLQIEIVYMHVEDFEVHICVFPGLYYCCGITIEKPDYLLKQDQTSQCYQAVLN